MTGSGHEIKIHFLQYIFTTRLLARFHYVLSGFFRSKWDFSGQNEFLPTQHRLGIEYYVDLHVQADPALSLRDVHILSGKVKGAICAAVPRVVGVLIHMEPYEED